MKPLSVLFVTLAPLLSMVDAVDAAPAAGIGSAVHRRAVGNMAHAPWHKRQGEAAGPPSVITVGGPENPEGATPTTTDTTSTESAGSTDSAATGTGTTTTSAATTGTTTTTSTDTTSSSSTSLTTDTGTTTTASSTDFLSSFLSGLLPTDPTTTTTTDPGTPTDPATQPTVTDPAPTTTSGGILDPITSLIGDVTSGLGSVTSDIGGGITSATDTLTDLPPTNTEQPVTDPPPTSETNPPTITNPPTDTGSETISISTTVPPLDPDGVFPGGNNGTQSITTTVSDPVKPTTLSIDSDYQFISASTFVIAPTTTSALDVTNTDPDAVQTSGVVAASGTTLTMASIPTSIPMFITPPSSSDPTAPGTDIPGYTEISILFKSTANWLWVLGSSETAAQILAYMGPLISTALDIPGEQVKTVGLKAFVPNDYTEEGDLQTLWLGQIPTEQVSTLSALIHTPNSRFYRSGDSVADSIASNVVMSFNIATEAGVDSSNGAGTSSNSGSSGTNNSQRNAIIGVSVAFGVVVLFVTAWWLTKMYKGRQEGSHKRLSYRNNTNYGSTAAGGNTAAFAAGAGGVTYGGYDRQSRGDPGVRADSPPMLHNPFLTDQEREEQARGIRRNSFYAIGPDDESIEEETFDYLSQRTSTISGGPHGGAAGLNRAGSSGSGGRGGNAWGPGTRAGQTGAVRRPVIGQPISQPILRESSMGNW